MTVNQPTVIIHVKYLFPTIDGLFAVWLSILITKGSRPHKTSEIVSVCLRYIFVKVKGGSRTGASGARPLVRKYL